MNRILFLISAFFLITTSCYHENHPQIVPPEHLLSRNDMVNILTDIYVTEGILTYHRMNKELTDGLSAMYYDKVLNEHQITHRILKDNLKYYNSTPELMEQILEDVLANLSKMQAEISAIKEDVQDSVSYKLYDTLPDTYIPSIFYQEAWSYAALIDTLLMMPLDSVPVITSDSVFEKN